jgi:hypothetical protein
MSTLLSYKVNATICSCEPQHATTTLNPPLETAASNTYLPAVIAVAMIVGKYKGNQEGKRFYSRNCASNRSDSIESCLCPLWFERNNITVREHAPWTFDGMYVIFKQINTTRT